MSQHVRGDRTQPQMNTTTILLDSASLYLIIHQILLIVPHQFSYLSLLQVYLLKVYRTLVIQPLPNSSHSLLFLSPSCIPPNWKLRAHSASCRSPNRWNYFSLGLCLVWSLPRMDSPHPLLNMTNSYCSFKAQFNSYLLQKSLMFFYKELAIPSFGLPLSSKQKSRFL